MPPIGQNKEPIKRVIPSLTLLSIFDLHLDNFTLPLVIIRPFYSKENSSNIAIPKVSSTTY